MFGRDDTYDPYGSGHPRRSSLGTAFNCYRPKLRQGVQGIGIIGPMWSISLALVYEVSGNVIGA